MQNKIFISWSGRLGQELGKVVSSFFTSVLHITPYFSPEAEKGSDWTAKIQDELTNLSIGIVILTPESISSPWILFEAGALSKGFDNSRVCPILFNLTPSDIQKPLAMFQCTTFNKDDFYKLTTTINNHTCKMEAELLSKTFEKWWGDFHTDIEKTLNGHNNQGETKKPKPNQTQMIEEILQNTRDLISRRSPVITRVERTTCDYCGKKDFKHRMIERDGNTFCNEICYNEYKSIPF